MTREQSYAALVRARRACTRCIGLRNPAVVADGRFDSSEIGPWTVWQNRLDARVMVVGQDFSDVAYFEKWQGRDQRHNPTNDHLVALLRSVGIEVAPFDESRGRSTAFFTNAILCLKEGGMQAKVRDEWFLNCGERFLRPQIELVRPLVVICLGQKAHDAVLRAFGLPRQPLRESVASAGTRVLDNTHIVAVYHCGARTTRLTRSFEQQLVDWTRVSALLNAPAT
jgi:uracil-DNA glycosylase